MNRGEAQEISSKSYFKSFKENLKKVSIDQ